MSQEKLVLVVKVHEVSSQTTAEKPTVKATFTSPSAGQSYAWSTQEGKSSDSQKWTFEEASPDFEWSEGGALLVQFMSGETELGQCLLDNQSLKANNSKR